MKETVSKTLTANDLGLTGGHQAGILIPKTGPIFSFFPELPKGIKNPRLPLLVKEQANGTTWRFNFVYYNNKSYGGTRDEYRLTGMTQYLRAIDARVGDELRFTRDEDESICIECVRAEQHDPERTRHGGVLVLGGGWKYINY